MTYILIAGGTLAVSVHVLYTYGTGGDVSCVLLMINSTLSDAELGPYPAGITYGLGRYAQSSMECDSVVFSKYCQYFPYIMLMQTIFLIVIDKFTMRMPGIQQKIERFYRYIIRLIFF